MSNRVLLVTGYTDSIRKPEDTDLKIEEIANITLPSKQRYAAKHGYDLLSLTSFNQDFGKFFKNFTPHIGFLRVLRTAEMLQFYDVVMWIDADSLITNMDYKIEDFKLDNSHCFYASYDWAWTKSFSTGNFILKRTSNLMELLNVFFAESYKFPEEQQTLNALYSQTSLREYMKILDHKYLNSIPNEKMYNGSWEGRSRIISPWSTESFLLHMTGVTNKTRIDILDTYFSDYI